MNENDLNEFNASAPPSPNERPEGNQNSETNQPAERPYGDAGNLYEIPGVRPDDPPMRNWWTDDEPRQERSGSQNG